MFFALVHLYFLVSAWNKNCHKNIVNMHRLHDVWQFSETSLKHRKQSELLFQSLSTQERGPSSSKSIATSLATTTSGLRTSSTSRVSPSCPSWSDKAVIANPIPARVWLRCHKSWQAIHTLTAAISLIPNASLKCTHPFYTGVLLQAPSSPSHPWEPSYTSLSWRSISAPGHRLYP